MKAGEHGPDRLYNKFIVAKTKDTKYDMRTGWYSIPEHKRLGHGEFIFVLRPETNDLAAIAALEKYAEICGETYPGLAAQIVDELTRIKRDYPQGNPALRDA